MNTTPILHTAHQALSGIDPADLDNTARIALAAAAAQIATADAIAVAAQAICDIAEYAGGNYNTAVSLANETENLVKAVKQLQP
ncbi:hypothetical protein [Mycobacterium sp.]|uniref:hypothetical protein n=1 Tax=Mycobacterium sp. TaxID=1785 RepID=UPI0025FFD46D|nr:hypothetical protein [Mycobacterium sp.]